MTTIHIPETIEGARAQLGGIERLLTAKGWERAAIVYAFTYEPGSPGPRKADSVISHYLTCNEFAALGLHGLTSNETVYRIRGYWQGRIDVGDAAEVNPGDEVALPTADYPASGLNEGKLRNSFRKNASPDETAEAIQNVLTDRPEVAKRIEDAFVERAIATDTPLAKRVENAFVQKAAKDTTLYSRVDHAWSEQHPVPLEPRQPVMALNSLGFGSAVYLAVQQKHVLLPQLVDYLRLMTERDDPEVGALAREEIDGLERAKGLIDQYIDAVRAAIGVDYEANARRLLSEG